MITVAGQLEEALRRSSHQLPRRKRREGEGDIHCAIGGNVTSACQPRALIERSGDVIVGPGSSPTAIRMVAHRGEHDDRHARHGAQLLAQLRPSSRGSVTSRITRSIGCLPGRDLFQHRHNLPSRSQTRNQAGKNRT
jgi:hypothetical protein